MQRRDRSRGGTHQSPLRKPGVRNESPSSNPAGLRTVRLRGDDDLLSRPHRRLGPRIRDPEDLALGERLPVPGVVARLAAVGVHQLAEPVALESAPMPRDLLRRRVGAHVAGGRRLRARDLMGASPRSGGRRRREAGNAQRLVQFRGLEADHDEVRDVDYGDRARLEASPRELVHHLGSRPDGLLDVLQNERDAPFAEVVGGAMAGAAPRGAVDDDRAGRGGAPTLAARGCA